MGIKILQWNSRSIKPKKCLLEQILAENEISVCVLSETWLKPSETLNIKGFQIIRQDRLDGKAGVAILIKNGIIYEPIPSVQSINHLMIVGIQLKELNCIHRHINIYSLYKNPKNKCNKRQWDMLFTNFQRPFICAGDFNAHHIAWGCDLTDSEGIQLLESVEDNNLLFLNDGSATRITRPNTNKSAVNLTLTDHQLAAQMSWSIYEDSMGSDHLPIVMEVSVNDSMNSKRLTGGLNLKRTDWKLFKEMSEKNMSEDKILNYTDFKSKLNEITIDSTPKRKESKKSGLRSKHWWNDDCKNAVLDRIKLLKQYKAMSSVENFLLYKNASAKTTLTINKAKRDSWISFCNNLNRQTPMKVIWKNINKIKGISTDCNGQQAIHGEWSKKFLEKLTVPDVPVQIQLEDDNNACEILEGRIKEGELLAVLKNNINSFPAKKALLKTFNEIMISKDIPNDWKKYIIVPILKPNKIPFQEDSYRPIALASCVLKTFEKIIKARLNYWLEINKKFPKTQFGYRKRSSCMDGISTLLTDINIAFANDELVMALFVDIEGAYDNVLHDILVKKMKSIGITNDFLYLIDALLKDREIF